MTWSPTWTETTGCLPANCLKHMEGRVPKLGCPEVDVLPGRRRSMKLQDAARDWFLSRTKMSDSSWSPLRWSVLHADSETILQRRTCTPGVTRCSHDDIYRPPDSPSSGPVLRPVLCPGFQTCMIFRTQHCTWCRVNTTPDRPPDQFGKCERSIKQVV